MGKLALQAVSWYNEDLKYGWLRVGANNRSREHNLVGGYAMDTIPLKSPCAKCGSMVHTSSMWFVRPYNHIVSWCVDCILNYRGHLETIVVSMPQKPVVSTGTPPLKRMHALHEAKPPKYPKKVLSPEEQASQKRLVRDRMLQMKYGITHAEYDDMLIKQAGVCAICEKPPREGKALCVDHDHKTGRIRQLLCDVCNTLLGAAGDDIERLRRAIAYLEKHS